MVSKNLQNLEVEEDKNFNNNNSNDIQHIE